MSGHDRILLAIIAVFVILALAWNIFIPPYENLDEIEHAEVIRHIVMTGKLPVHGEAEEAGFHVRQEASQPPLYHILAAGWARLWRLPADPQLPLQVPGDVMECGPSATFYNRANWTRSPYAEGPPWSGRLLTLHALRLFSTLLQIATVAGAWVLTRRVFPQGPLPILTTALVAFNPQFLLIASGVNNDNLIIPLATGGLVLAYDLWEKGPAPWRLILFGALSGLAALSKLSGIALLGLGGLALLARVWQKKTAFSSLVGWGMLMALPALLIMAPWLLRNLRLYRDPTALAPMLDMVGHRQGSATLGEAKLMALSYWGQMPCSFYPRAIYWPYLLLMAGGLVGVVVRWPRFSRRQQLALGLAAAWFIAIVVAWIRWDSITPAPGGRLLFPAIAALALILAAGWSALATLKGRRIVRLASAFLPLLALVTLRAGPMLLFSPPPLLKAGSTLPNPTDIAFGEQLSLRGYEARMAEPAAACALASTSFCGPALDVTLYWQAQSPVPENRTMALQLVSPVPGKTDMRLNYSHWPGHGNLPTSAWPVDRIIRDHYLLPLPDSALPTGAWALQIAFFDITTGERLPVRVGDVGVGDTARLTTLRVPGAAPELPGWNHPATPVVFGDAVILQDARAQEDGDVWRVSLFWESRTPLAEDYTVFVHAYGADGTLLATGDGPPQNGGFPTSLWQPGDRIEDVHFLALPEGPAPARIAAGLYHPGAGERLPAFAGATRLQDDAVVIWQAPR